ncbi:4-hydroxy-tetrahydrodipicolinate synthase [Eubacteriales bacterium OttesenSCG-928-N13]|nr:4-hydroxy-tetrahydrodipicolinate synthase [Eubacteriales bacterium OttesenSCG-928-N13]
MFKGSFVALVTPFLADGSVDFDRLRQLCEWHIEQGTDGLVVLGTTGESSTMTHEEDEDVVRCALEVVAGRIPVIAGAGSNCTQTALEKSLAYEKLGVDGLLLITPYYNKANARGMIEHFRVIADQVHTPIIMYNVPGRTGCNLPVACVEELSKHKNIVALKEASGNISYAAQVARYISDDFALFSGNDDMIVPMMSLGGAGVISVFANICPKQCHDMVQAWLDGDIQAARDMQLKYLDLINALFIEVNPIPVKEAMNLMGLHVGGYRLPLCPMEDKNREALKAALRVLEDA